MTNIYLITNKITKQQYVGKTVHSIKCRFGQHTRAQNNTYIDNAIKSYGKDNFSLELLKTCDDSEWQYWEQYYIKELHTHYSEGGYNLSWGGDANPMDVEEVRQRHAKACASEEHREKQRVAATGRKHTEESRKKMSEIQKQVYSDPELRRKVKIHQPAIVPVKMLDDNDNVVMEFESLSDACRYFNKSTKNTRSIKLRLDVYNKNGKRAKFWGYAWVRSNKKV